ncbi:MAG: sarcosine oxidase subunit gamma family protein [Ancalomicrobiaceae bacterium]|nr:sarcosine oxidase subunit gamma family protein [Ancalomicrobiaceae bacterium]
MAEAQRIAAFAGLGSIGRTGRFLMEPLPNLARFIFRGSEAAAHDLGLAFGADLSREPLKANATADGRAALWLGPDEWLLIGPEADHAAILGIVAATVIEPSSLVDISHRNTGILLSGSRVEPVLNAGCPLDLDVSAFPVGMSTRTVLAKVEIVLWRKAASTFHLECGRSFAPYVHGFVAEAAREFLG